MLLQTDVESRHLGDVSKARAASGQDLGKVLESLRKLRARIG